MMPRFHKEAFEHNVKLGEKAKALADKKGCTPAQLAINWARQHGEVAGRAPVIPIPGSSTPARVEENSKVIELTDEEVEEINAIVNSFEVVGDRYPPQFPTNT